MAQGLKSKPTSKLLVAGIWLVQSKCHDDVIKWKHFPRYWPFVRGSHRSPVNSPRIGQWRAALVFLWFSAWTNGWVNSRDSGDLGLHRAHYNATVMVTDRFVSHPVTINEPANVGESTSMLWRHDAFLWTRFIEYIIPYSGPCHTIIIALSLCQLNSQSSSIHNVMFLIRKTDTDHVYGKWKYKVLKVLLMLFQRWKL